MIKLRPLCKDPQQGFELLRKAIGAEDLDFLYVILFQLSDACTRDGAVDQDQLNFLFSIIKSFKPRDQIHAMLAAQMSVVHLNMMEFARPLTTIPSLL